MAVCASGATAGVQIAVHDTDAYAVTRRTHGGAGPPHVHHRVVPVDPVTVVTAARGVVASAHRIKGTLYKTSAYIGG